MATYGLTRQSLDKLLTKLVDRDLLESGEIRARRSFPETIALEIPPNERKAGAPKNIAFQQSELGISRRNRLGKRKDTSSECPQCKAAVSQSMLLCPECGHMLPGQERWEQVEPGKRFIDRIPAKVLGCVIALPIAIVLAFVFKDIIIPMTNVTIEKRADELRRKKELKKSAHRPTSHAEERADVSSELSTLVEDLIDRQILSEASSDLTVLTTGLLWKELSEDEQVTVLEDLRSEMLRSRTRFQFDVVDSDGVIVGRGSEDSISVMTRQTP